MPPRALSARQLAHRKANTWAVVRRRGNSFVVLRKACLILEEDGSAYTMKPRHLGETQTPAQFAAFPWKQIQSVHTRFVPYSVMQLHVERVMRPTHMGLVSVNIKGDVGVLQSAMRNHAARAVFKRRRDAKKARKMRAVRLLQRCARRYLARAVILPLEM